MSSGPRLAAEVKAELEARASGPRNSPETQARLDALRAAASPIIEDLRALGYDVKTVWDLGNSGEPYTSAVPVLVEHLSRGGYPEGIMEGLGTVLAVKEAAPYWEVLLRCYRRASGGVEAEGIARALAASATKPHLDTLIELVRDEKNPARIHFLRPIKRLGAMKGREVLAELAQDPRLGAEAQRLLKASRR